MQQTPPKAEQKPVTVEPTAEEKRRKMLDLNTLRKMDEIINKKFASLQNKFQRKRLL
jgi:hypothetical protein